MMGTTIRISQRSHETLRALAQTAHESMQAVLDKAVEAYRRKLFLEEVNRAYADLREDREAWGELESERAAWDSTLADGLPERRSGSRGRPRSL